jgi:hypothetical protein
VFCEVGTIQTNSVLQGDLYAHTGAGVTSVLFMAVAVDRFVRARSHTDAQYAILIGQSRPIEFRSCGFILPCNHAQSLAINAELSARFSVCNLFSISSEMCRILFPAAIYMYNFNHPVTNIINSTKFSLFM